MKKKTSRLRREYVIFDRDCYENDSRRRKIGQIFQSTFFLSIVRRSILSLAREELSPLGGIFGARSIIFVRGESEGRRISRRVSIARGGLLAFISGSVASQDPALFSCAARPFYLRPIWQRTFNSMRLAHFVDYCTRPLYPKLIVFARIFLRRILGDYLGSRITAGKWPPFQIRSSIRPVSSSSFRSSSSSSSLLETTLRYNTETFLEFLLAIPVNKFEDGCRNPSPSIFEISILDDTWIERERENWTYRETELDRSKILAIRSNAE